MKNKDLFHKIYSLISLFRVSSVLIFAQACTGADKTQVADEKLPETQNSEHQYTSAVFRNADSTYGYEILMDGDAVIRQAIVPTTEGIAGFTDSISALRMSEFVLYKLQNEHFPPSVSRDETDSILNSIK